MSSVESRAYHHGGLRQVLLDAAVLHIAAHGTEGLSLRALAREAGVSATAPYRHFENRQALLAALATEGFRELGARMETVSQRLASEPVKVFFAAGLAYVDYARHNAVKYHLMFGDTIGDFMPFADLHEAARQAYAHFEHIIQVGIESGALLQIPLREMGGTVWSMVHGVAGILIASDSKSSFGMPGVVADMPPLDAQQRVRDAPGRVLLHLSRGLIIDPEGLAELERLHGS